MSTLNVPRMVLALVEMVKFELAPPVPGVKLAGKNLQLAPLGSPEQESETGTLNGPPMEPTVTVDCAACPCFTLTESGLAAMEKSTPVPLRATLRLVVTLPSEPITVSAPERVPKMEGVNVALKMQDAPPRTPEEAQVLVSEKSPVVPIPEK
jgi:hypothetical protein